ncbi:MAG: hypothetical protein IKU66_05315 [Clostridia bacterium]|nr:hypothetical protein [Clostridia bacterium]
MSEFTHRVILKWKKDLDDAILGEIKQKAIENGLETEYSLNETSFMNIIKKQVPSAVRRDFYRVYCPTCHEPLELFGAKYCCTCGQMLDWKE